MIRSPSELEPSRPSAIGSRNAIARALPTTASEIARKIPVPRLRLGESETSSSSSSESSSSSSLSANVRRIVPGRTAIVRSWARRLAPK